MGNQDRNSVVCDFRAVASDHQLCRAPCQPFPISSESGTTIRQRLWSYFSRRRRFPVEAETTFTVRASESFGSQPCGSEVRIAIVAELESCDPPELLGPSGDRQAGKASADRKEGSVQNAKSSSRLLCPDFASSLTRWGAPRNWPGFDRLSVHLF